MLNQGTFRLRIDSLQCSLKGENLSAIGYCSIEFRSRAETVTSQIEFHSQGNAAYGLQEAGKGAIGVAVGSLEVYAPMPERGQPNHRTILRIANFLPMTPASVTAAPTQRQQRQPLPRQQSLPRQQRQTRQQQPVMPPVAPIPVAKPSQPQPQQQQSMPPIPVTPMAVAAGSSPTSTEWEEEIPI